MEVLTDVREFLPNTTQFSTCRSALSGMFQAFVAASPGAVRPRP